MTIKQYLRARMTIAKVAKQNGISTDRCRADIAESIRAAWDTSDPVIKDRQIRLVGEDRVPSPEEFIFLVSKLDL